MRRVQIARLRLGVEAAEFGLRALGPTRPDRVEQLRDFRDFMAFTEQDARHGLAERWERYRQTTRADLDERTDDHD